MSLTSGESRDLKNMAHGINEIAKVLKAMNENMLGLTQNVNNVLELLANQKRFEIGDFVKVVDPDSMARGEVGRIVESGTVVEASFASGSGGEFRPASLDDATPEEYEESQKYWENRRQQIRQEDAKAGRIGFPAGWSNMDLVQVTDPAREEYGRQGVVVEGRVWSNNAELGVRFGEASMTSTKSYFNPGQLKKISRKEILG